MKQEIDKDLQQPWDNKYTGGFPESAWIKLEELDPNEKLVDNFKIQHICSTYV